MATNKEKVLKYAQQTQYAGVLEKYMGKGETAEPDCSDIMTFYIDVEREIISNISYTITETACAPVKACAALTAELAKGKAVLEAYLISKDQLSEFFGGLDKEHLHCAIMAELTLKRAILDYVKTHKNQ